MEDQSIISSFNSIRSRKRFANFGDRELPISIKVGINSKSGYINTAVYVDPFIAGGINDSNLIGKRYIVFYENQGDKKLYLPNPPFKGDDGTSND